MNFIILRENILPILNTVCGFVDKRHDIAILNNLLVVVKEDEIIFTASNGEVEIITKLKHIAESTGEATIPARKLFDICRALNKDASIDFELKEKNITLKAAKSKFILAILPPKEFPTSDVLNDSKSFTVTCEDFRALLDSTQFSMANNDARYSLNGLLLELEKDTVRAVATDGHRLAIKEIKTANDINDLQQVIVSRRGVLELSRILQEASGELRIEIDDKYIRASTGNNQFSSKLIDGRYPDYKKVIPEDGEHVITVATELLKQILVRVTILSPEKYRSIKLCLKSGLLRIFSKNNENEEAQEEVEIDYVGDEFEVGFNAIYLQQAIAHINTEQTIFKISSPDSSCLILPGEEQNCKYVVMPMRL